MTILVNNNIIFNEKCVKFVAFFNMWKYNKQELLTQLLYNLSVASLSTHNDMCSWNNGLLPRTNERKKEKKKERSSVCLIF